MESDSIQLNYSLCISDGTTPKPTSNPLAECSQLPPGDKYNFACPINACCSLIIILLRMKKTRVFLIVQLMTIKKT